jgi:hypothetical protein
MVFMIAADTYPHDQANNFLKLLIKKSWLQLEKSKSSLADFAQDL